jgi:hypothetical protein
MSARIFLNELKTDKRLLANPESGAWKADRDFLARFSNDILVTGEVADRIVNSVPSVFARPIQFSEALFDEKHPLHQTFRNQWRGLLTLFALRKALAIPLSVTLFSLRKPEAIRADDRDRRFSLVLRNQLPRPEAEWENWLLLYCQGKLVGATSPWTVVYTPAAYRIEEGAPWIDANGALDDPWSSLYDPNGGNEELATLNAWLVQLIALHPWGMAAHHDREAGAIRKALETWRTEIDQKVKPRTDAKSLDRSFEAASAPYSHFLSAIDVPPLRTTIPSDLLLNDNDGCGAIVLSRKALQAPQMRKKRIDGAVRVEDLNLEALKGPEGKAGWRARTGAEILRPYVIAEEYFLSNRILRIPLTENAISVGSLNYSLPLKPAFLKHFSHTKIMDIVSMQVDGDRVAVRLRLPLRNGETLTVEKTYKVSENVETVPEGTLIPSLAVWPDFYDSEWTDNEAILVQTAPRTHSILFAPLFEEGDAEQGFAIKEDAPSVAVWECTKPPLGFAVFIKDADGRSVDAGLIVRANTEPPRKTGAVWNVGIDFGTSNTQVMLKTSDEDSRLVLHGRALPLVAASDVNELQLNESTHHIGAVTPPFPTLLRRGTVSVISKGGGSVTPRGVMSPKINLITLGLNADTYVRDVKWTADGSSQKEYLEHLARMVVTEARAAGASQLRFEWSYPLSLPARIRSTMETFWSSVGNAYTRKGLQVTSGPGMTESDAICRCVAAHEMLPILAGNLSISLDIGGGSTDIGFWSDKTLIDRLSFNVAGNDIVRLAAGFQAVNRELVAAAGGFGTGEEFLGAFRKQPEILWNALLSEGAHKNQALGDAPHAHPLLTTMGRANSAEWRKCRTAVTIAFGGIFFYAGVHSGRHFKQASAGVAIYVGGKGSALLSWIGPPDRVREVLQKYFEAGFSIGNKGTKVGLDLYGPVVGIGGGSEVRIALKDEVASGLLEGDALKAAVGADLDLGSTAVGEVNWVDGDRELPWNEMVSAEKLARLSPPANDNSSFVAYFLKQVLRPSAESNDLDSEGLQKLQVSQNWTINAIRKKVDEQVLQPIFAYELKSLVRRYAESVAASKA